MPREPKEVKVYIRTLNLNMNNPAYSQLSIDMLVENLTHLPKIEELTHAIEEAIRKVLDA
jgi:hypothetical protein